VTPPLPRGRAIVLTVLAEYAASAFFGAITFLGGFAFDIGAGHDAFVDLLQRGVWIAFLVVACLIVVRIWLGLFQTVPEPSYGKPYPGQPLIPAPSPVEVDDTPTTLLSAPTASSPTGTIRLPADADPPTQVLAQTPPEQPQDEGSGWPEVPPPPMPNAIVLEPDPTMRIVLPPSEPPAPRSGD
jgi:hypothetical protein